MENKKTMELKNIITSSIPIIASAITFYFSAVQYFYSQNLIDRRKYINKYYDERYRVLNELAKSTTKIYSLVNNVNSNSNMLYDSIKSELLIFNYAYLVLNASTSDSIILIKIEQFQDYLYTIIDDENAHTIPIKELYETNKSILQESGKIFSDEKDIINSFKFKLFPFSDSPKSSNR